MHARIDPCQHCSDNLGVGVAQHLQRVQQGLGLGRAPAHAHQRGIGQAWRRRGPRSSPRPAARPAGSGRSARAPRPAAAASRPTGTARGRRRPACPAVMNFMPVIGSSCSASRHSASPRSTSIRPGRGAAVQPVLEGRLPHVALDRQHALAAQLGGAAQRQGQQRFAFRRPGGGDGDDLRMVDIQRQAGAQRAHLFGERGQRPADDVIVDFQMPQRALADLRDQREAGQAGEQRGASSPLCRVLSISCSM